MQLKTRIIVIGPIKYGDTSLIARCYSETLGFQSYLLKGILSAKKTGLKKGLFQPFSELAAVVYHHPQRQLHHIREAQLIASSHFQQPDVVQQTITLFLAEVVQEVLQEEAEPNPGLYAFLASAIQFLEHSAYKAHFHLKVLIEMTKVIGCYPSVDSSEK
ncbi:MAG: recombination protein O N-terminal domain-containing protein, partial [Flavobacteriaceae bacterium]